MIKGITIMYYEVLVKTYRDSISHHELLTQYGHINEIYNGHMDLILWVFATGIAVLGIILPIGLNVINFKYLEKKVSDEFEKKYDLKINEKMKELEEKSKKNLNHQNNVFMCHKGVTDGILFKLNNQYRESLEIFLRAVYGAVLTKEYEVVQYITINIKNDPKFQTVDMNKVSPQKKYSVGMYLDKIEKKAESDRTANLFLNEFIKVLPKFK